jgi:16S rRNA processing protein RimM
MLNEYLQIGVVVKPQGILGQVKIKPFADDPELFTDLSTVYIEADGGIHPLPLHDVSVREGFVFAWLGPSASREEAEKQRGLELLVHRKDAAPLPEDRHFIVDLIGCRVENLKGQPVGTLVDILQPGANDVYVVKTPDGRRLLVPALKRAIPRVEVENRLVFVDEAVLSEVALFEN